MFNQAVTCKEKLDFSQYWGLKGQYHGRSMGYTAVSWFLAKIH